MKILVINLMPAIGELLFVTPVFKVLRQAFPEATIEALLASQVHQICAYNPYIDTVITIDKTGDQTGILEHYKLIRKIRKVRYDLVINLNPSERASLIAAFSKGKRICGFASKWLNPFFNPWQKKDRSIHSADAYLKALNKIGIPSQTENYLEMRYNEKAEEKSNRIWQDNFLPDSNVVGIHPGANWPNKRWKPEYLAMLSDMLQQRNIKTVFFGGRDDLQIVDKVVELCKVKPVIMTGKLTLLELAAMVEKCSVFVSADSGPMHIAVSQRVPVVALFGPTSPTRYGPYNVAHRIIQPDSNCIMCGSGRCKFETNCMEFIAPEKVFHAVLDLLSN